VGLKEGDWSAILQSLPFPLPLFRLILTPATAKRQIARGHKKPRVSQSARITKTRV